MLTYSQQIVSKKLKYTTHINDKPLLFHHARNLEHVLNGEVKQYNYIPQHEYNHNCYCQSCLHQDYHPAYLWLQEKTSFYPLFLAVGNHPDAQNITGYSTQWLKNANNNQILFSYLKAPKQTIFCDYMNWHYVLNSISLNRQHIEEKNWAKNTVKSILRPKWGEKQWLSYSKQKPGYTQAVTPKLDLSSADLIRCRNQKVKKQLITQGFPEQKIIIERWPTQY